MHKYEELLSEARRFKADWNLKAQRLYEVTAHVDPGKHVRRDIEEASTNYLIINTHLKVAALMGQLRASIVRYNNAPPEVATYFRNIILNSALSDIEDMLKDRFITGLGVLAVGSEKGRAFLYRISPLDIL